MNVSTKSLPAKRNPVRAIAVASCLAVSLSVLGAGGAAETDSPLTSLKTISVPEPVNLREFVKDKRSAIALGKALFWDMQVGSSGIQACASCHFHAGADNRIKNSISPGLLANDTSFQLGGPNSTVSSKHFPLTSFKLPDEPGFEKDPGNKFTSNINDVMSSQGVRHFEFTRIVRGTSYERANFLFDPVFNVHGKSTRRVEPRNTPTVINSIFNFSSFWDGRARNIFNGVNPFGELDETARVFLNGATGLQPTKVRIPDASLASQAVGPPGSDFEMSSLGRTFPKIGRKLLALQPLAIQYVSPEDSVLGPYSAGRGLNISYGELIRRAFIDKWWDSDDQAVRFTTIPEYLHRPDPGDSATYYFLPGVPEIVSRPKHTQDLGENEFTQMEANFSLFFGLAIQLYEATLVSDDAKFDRVAEGRDKFTEEEAKGFGIFLGEGKCNNCHQAPEFMNHSVRNVRQDKIAQAPGFLPVNLIEFMDISNRKNIIYDNGFYNVGVRPAGSTDAAEPGFVPNNEDVARGNSAPQLNPLTGKSYPLSVVRLAKLKALGLLPSGVAVFVPDLPPGVPADTEVAVDGSQKAPGLRNVELTGPYFHNGDAATLRQVVEFYTRGGNFPVTNAFNLDPDIDPIGGLRGAPDKQRQLVAFLLTLTDERVRNEKAPFDHPQLFVPNGSAGDDRYLFCKDDHTPGYHLGYCDDLMEVPAVGAEGRPNEGLPPLDTFLALDPKS
ncbi:MAG: cytochrome C peroxidase [Oligoflexia bacterium]|nr:cytochrome C peroxidase [Oligoflexia bacterium]